MQKCRSVHDANVFRRLSRELESGILCASSSFMLLHVGSSSLAEAEEDCLAFIINQFKIERIN